MFKNLKITGRRFLGGNRYLYMNMNNNEFITETIETRKELDNFLEKLSKEDFNYQQSDESWIKSNQKIYQNYTKNKKETVINTIKTIFNKLAVGCYVQIRNNKIMKYVHLTNLEFRNNWVKNGNIVLDKDYIIKRTNLLKKMNLSERRLRDELNYEDDDTKWTANGCLIGTWKNPSYKGFKRLYIYHDLISKALEKLKPKMINCDFIINRRDFPFVKSDNSHPYDLGNTNKFFEYPPLPVLSSCVSQEFADFGMPTRDDWEVGNGNNDRFRDNFKWENKIEKVVWRGNGTNCGTTEKNNQRLQLHQMGKDNTEYMNVGIIGWNPRDKFDKKTKKLSIIDSTKFRQLVNRMGYNEQFEYKYHLNLDGHVSAFRLGYLLSQNILILQVESNYGWYLWYQKNLIPYDIYHKDNPNNKKSHYILVKKDLSNLIEIIKWCRNNDGIVKQIILRATSYYQFNLKKNNLIERVGTIIKNI